MQPAMKRYSVEKERGGESKGGLSVRDEGTKEPVRNWRRCPHRRVVATESHSLGLWGNRGQRGGGQPKK